MSLSPSIKSTTRLSIVVPCYNEADSLDQLYAELRQVLDDLGISWEAIFIDDGSHDDSWGRIVSLNRRDERVKGIRLSRNFGHQSALLAGLFQTDGDAVVTIDADLQHPPQIVSELVRLWQANHKIVHTLRSDSESLPLLKRVTSKTFYRIFSVLSGVNLHEGMADFRLLDRQVVDQLLAFREDHLFFRGLSEWIGYPSATVCYQSRKRYSGRSKYSVRKMIRLALSGITSFSIIPLRLSVLIGIATAVVAFGELLYVVYVRLFVATVIPGWASAVGIISFLFGVLFILLGVIGEYIGRILIEVRRRPRFLISQQVGVEDAIHDDTR